MAIPTRDPKAAASKKDRSLPHVVTAEGMVGERAPRKSEIRRAAAVKSALGKSLALKVQPNNNSSEPPPGPPEPVMDEAALNKIAEAFFATPVISDPKLMTPLQRRMAWGGV